MTRIDISTKRSGLGRSCLARQLEAELGAAGGARRARGRGRIPWPWPNTVAESWPWPVAVAESNIVAGAVECCLTLTRATVLDHGERG